MLKTLGTKTTAALSLALGLSTVIFPSMAQVEDAVTTGRYTEVSNQINYVQSFPLSVIVDTTFPQSVITIQDALEFLLARSGYTLIATSEASESTRILFSHPVPFVQRSIKHVSLKNALSMLGGNEFNLIVDPVYRRISFELNDTVAELYEEKR